MFFNPPVAAVGNWAEVLQVFAPEGAYRECTEYVSSGVSTESGNYFLSLVHKVYMRGKHLPSNVGTNLEPGKVRVRDSGTDSVL